jgi:hypothetical protein
MFIHMQDYTVREIKAKDIRAFFQQFVRSRYLDINIRDLVNNTTRLSDSVLENLDEIEVDFTDYTRTSQFFFFKNTIWEATGEGIFEHEPATTSARVWKDQVLDHKIKRLEKAFSISHDDDQDASVGWDIQIPDNIQSNFFKFLINTSRIFWREELEYDSPPMTAAEREEYRKKYKFAIDGSRLSPEQVAEQKQHLINKIFALGYLLHNYKSDNRAWCVYAMDNRESDMDECNGGTGKSFCFKTPRYFMKSVTLSGRAPRMEENRHLFEGVTEHTLYPHRRRQRIFSLRFFLRHHHRRPHRQSQTHHVIHHSLRKVAEILYHK